MYVCMNGWMDGWRIEKKEKNQNRKREKVKISFSFCQRLSSKCVFPFLATLRRESDADANTKAYAKARKKTYPKPIPF